MGELPREPLTIRFHEVVRPLDTTQGQYAEVLKSHFSGVAGEKTLTYVAELSDNLPAALVRALQMFCELALSQMVFEKMNANGLSGDPHPQLLVFMSSLSSGGPKNAIIIGWADSQDSDQHEPDVDDFGDKLNKIIRFVQPGELIPPEK